MTIAQSASATLVEEGDDSVQVFLRPALLTGLSLSVAFSQCFPRSQHENACRSEMSIEPRELLPNLQE